MVPAPLLLFALVAGVLLGRSLRVMRSIAQAHQAVHTRADASAAAQATAENQNVIVIDPHGVRKVDGIYDLDTADGVARQIVAEVARDELVAGEGDGWDEWLGDASPAPREVER